MRATTRKKKALDLTVKNFKGELIEVVLQDGRKVNLRPMIGKDFIFIGRELKDVEDTEKSFKLIERLSVEPNNITYLEVLELLGSDLQILSEGLAQANGMVGEMEEEEVEEDEDE